MAGIPKVKITFDADFDELKRGVAGAQNEVQSFGDKMGKFGKMAGVAFAAASAAAPALASRARWHALVTLARVRDFFLNVISDVSFRFETK